MIPIAFRHEPKPGQKTIAILANATTGPKTNVALYENDSTGLKPLREQRYVSANYPSLNDIIHDFCGNTLPDRIAAAVAGPVIDGKSKLTNLPWDLDSTAMSRDMKIPVSFINDLEATAYGLAGLKEDQRATLAAGDP